jgi:hypothetical protein
VFDALKEEYPVSDVEDVSISIDNTGYKPNLSFLERISFGPGRKTRTITVHGDIRFW